MYRFLSLFCTGYACMFGAGETLGLDVSNFCRSQRDGETTKVEFVPSPALQKSKLVSTRRVTVAAIEGDPLTDLPVCSARTAPGSTLKDICSVKDLAKGKEINITLTTTSSSVNLAGYSVTTENYNDSYVTPVIEANPGDTVTAHIVNQLKPRQHDMPHGDADQNPTNLHYFHGGIVSPANARPGDAELGTGDNVYVHLKSGFDFNLSVHIPGDGELDGGVLEAKNPIAHPTGLDWYHSHEHGISSDQVMGGMSSLLSVGEALANVKAKCSTDPALRTQCDHDTLALKQSTQVHYLLLRDLPLKNITAPPSTAQGATADWDPSARDFFGDKECGVWTASGAFDLTPAVRLGFCQVHVKTAAQVSDNTAWLFTVNGQRFPTITVSSRQNALLRIGNVGSNVPYWLELQSEDGKSILPLTVLSRDGVVPTNPVDPADPIKPVDAKNDDNLLLMPAARAEVYVRNDQKIHSSPEVWILRTRGLKTGFNPEKTDQWPEIQLAKIILQPNDAQSGVGLALNAPVERIRIEPAAAAAAASPTEMPVGCVRDIDPSLREYRRVTFNDLATNAVPDPHPRWTVATEIIRPTAGAGVQDEKTFKPDNPNETTIGLQNGQPKGFPFEKYIGGDGRVDWTTTKHVCIKLNHLGSHQQLWVLVNKTGTVHNFHIHQMKFRLAVAEELANHLIKAPPGTFADTFVSGYNYKIYDDVSHLVDGAAPNPDWHDTIPIPSGASVFIVMSFDAQQQTGRFVYHCHILKHEDSGLMAPIEVWDPNNKSL
jgi:FtsP/CotA-like multicopper oxidase with cupredoxin domain